MVELNSDNIHSLQVMNMILCINLIDFAMYFTLHLAYVMSIPRASITGNQLRHLRAGLKDVGHQAAFFPCRAQNA